jgi:hypothetical protein
MSKFWKYIQISSIQNEYYAKLAGVVRIFCVAACIFTCVGILKEFFTGYIPSSISIERFDKTNMPIISFSSDDVLYIFENVIFYYANGPEIINQYINQDNFDSFYNSGLLNLTKFDFEKNYRIGVGITTWACRFDKPPYPDNYIYVFGKDKLNDFSRSTYDSYRLSFPPDPSHKLQTILFESLIEKYILSVDGVDFTYSKFQNPQITFVPTHHTYSFNQLLNFSDKYFLQTKSKLVATHEYKLFQKLNYTEDEIECFRTSINSFYSNYNIQKTSIYTNKYTIAQLSTLFSSVISAFLFVSKWELLFPEIQQPAKRKFIFDKSVYVEQKDDEYVYFEPPENVENVYFELQESKI